MKKILTLIAGILIGSLSHGQPLPNGKYTITTTKKFKHVVIVTFKETGKKQYAFNRHIFKANKGEEINLISRNDTASVLIINSY